MFHAISIFLRQVLLPYHLVASNNNNFITSCASILLEIILTYLDILNNIIFYENYGKMSTGGILCYLFIIQNVQHV